jgi:hypothetical protein
VTTAANLELRTPYSELTGRIWEYMECEHPPQNTTFVSSDDDNAAITQRFRSWLIAWD